MELIHPSAYDAKERIKVMDEAGIRAAALYPNLGLLFTPLIDNFVNFELGAYRLECVRAYNDFVNDWISPDPTRFIALANIPFWDVQASVEEIERCAGLGFKGIVMTGLPHIHGQPYLADHHWDRLWGAAQAHEMPVSFHLGGGDLTKALPPDRVSLEGWNASVARTTVNLFFENAATLADLLLSGILPRFPGVKFVVVESGIGWIPFCLEAVDYHFLTSGVREERPEFEMLPSEYFHRQVYANCWFERLAPWHVDEVGVDNILFETDYPHPTSLLGRADVASAIDTGFASVDELARDKILWRNAAKLYGLAVQADET
jgi:predicted TIM-barrel fold metal-dependent hydrolase